MKAQDILPEGQDFVVKDGLAMRKGSVAAFLANAQILADPTSSAQARRSARQDLLDLVPTLDALGLFTVFELRSPDLRALVEQYRQASSCAPAQPS